MSLPDVAQGDPHIAAHNAERHLINNIQTATDADFLNAINQALGGPWIPNHDYVVGNLFSEPVTGYIRYVTANHHSGDEYTTDNSTLSPDAYYLRAVSQLGVSGWYTAQESIARAMGWIIATDLKYAGGVSTVAGVYSDDAMDAIYNTITGIPIGAAQPNFPIAALRRATADVWFPPGTINLKRAHKWVSIQSLRIHAAGSRSTSFMWGNETNNLVLGSSASKDAQVDAWALISCPNLEAESFRVMAGTGTIVNGSLFSVDCIPTVGATTASYGRLSGIYAEGGSGFWINGIAIGYRSTNPPLNNAGYDIAQFTLVHCRASGNDKASATYFQNGFQLGADVGGNILNYKLISCGVDFHKKAYVVASVDNVSMDNCNSSHNGTYLTATGRNNITCVNFRCESTNVLIQRGPTVTAPAKVSMCDFSFGNNGVDIDPNREIIKWYGQGTLYLRQATLDSAPPPVGQIGVDTPGSDVYGYKVFSSQASATQQFTLLVDGMTSPNADLESFFTTLGPTANVYAEFAGWSQYGTGGSDVGVHISHRTLRFGNARPNEDISLVQPTKPTAPTYTVVRTDTGKAIVASGDPLTVVIPLNATVPCSLNSWIDLESFGSTIKVVPADPAVIIRSIGNGRSVPLYGKGRLVQRNINEWLLTGNVDTSSHKATYVSSVKVRATAPLVTVGALPVIPDDVLIAVCGGQDFVNGVTPPAGLGWTLIGDSGDTPGAEVGRMQVWATRATSFNQVGGAWTFPGSAGHTVEYAAYRNVVLPTVALMAKGSGTPKNVVAPDATTLGAGAIAVRASYHSTGGAGAAWTGAMRSRLASGSGTNDGTLLDEVVAAAGPAGTRTYSVTSSTVGALSATTIILEQA